MTCAAMESQADTFDEDSASMFELSDQSATGQDRKRSSNTREVKKKTPSTNPRNPSRRQNVPTQDNYEGFEASSKRDSNTRSVAAKKKDHVVIESSRSPSSANSSAGSEEEEEDSAPNKGESEVNPEVRQAAIQWAANFNPPPSPSEIRDPERGAYSRRGKRKYVEAGPPASESRAKRLKPYLNADYLNILNIDIRHVVNKDVYRPEDSIAGSQIGASIWSSLEKQLFFDALARLGKSDLRSVAERVSTKSVLEVHEYVRLLDEGSKVQMQKDRKDYSESKFQMAIPSALEISGECCEVLERAGDAIASSQERQEEAKEKKKWGEDWLLTEAIGRQWSKEQNRRDKDGDGKKELLGEIHPAANLLKLNNWLALSRNVFMNPGALYEDDNWHNLAEGEETPAIRATALEDFHSLAVNITKRIVSTVQFCHMSRRRALGSSKAAVTSDEVDAAISILGLKHNSREFWVHCPERCNLQVTRPVEGTEEHDTMSYEEVEEALKSKGDLEVMSQSSRAQATVTDHSEISSLSSLLNSNDDFDWGSDSLHSDVDATDSDASNTTQPREQMLEKSLAKKEEILTQDQYVEARDIQSSQREEIKLWELLDQDPPLELEIKPIEESKIAGRFSGRARMQHAGWRERVEYWSAWEMFDSPIPKENFAANREPWPNKKNQQKYRLRGGTVEKELRDDDETGEDEQSDGDSGEEGSENSHMAEDSTSSRHELDGEEENVDLDEASDMGIDTKSHGSMCTIDEEAELHQQFLADQRSYRNFKSQSESESEDE